MHGSFEGVDTKGLRIAALVLLCSVLVVACVYAAHFLKPAPVWCESSTDAGHLVWELKENCNEQ